MAITSRRGGFSDTAMGMAHQLISLPGTQRPYACSAQKPIKMRRAWLRFRVTDVCANDAMKRFPIWCEGRRPLNAIRLCSRVAWDAFSRFNADDGWAIASHIALSVLMSMFPFLILVTALAGFLGSQNLAAEVGALIVAAWPPEVSGGIGGEMHKVLTTAR